MNQNTLDREANTVGARRSPAIRYFTVSVFTTLAHQAILVVANSGWGWSGGVANTFAATAVAVPGYFMNRLWVWESKGRHSLRVEILPFWGVALLGLAMASLFAEIADRVFGSGLPVAAGSLTGAVVVWVAKFVVLERLFAP